MSAKIRETFHVTHKDCRFETSRSSGAGGQNVNKRDTKVRCVHPPSGAHATSQLHREQHKNKVDAFQKMARTPEFTRWARIEASRRAGTLIDIDAAVEAALAPANVSVEVKDEQGRWRPANPDDFREDSEEKFSKSP